MKGCAWFGLFVMKNYLQITLINTVQSIPSHSIYQSRVLTQCKDLVVELRVLGKK